MGSIAPVPIFCQPHIISPYYYIILVITISPSSHLQGWSSQFPQSQALEDPNPQKGLALKVFSFCYHYFMSTRKHFYTSLGVTFWIITAIFVLLPSWPHLYYRLYPQASSLLASTIASTATQAQETLTLPAPSTNNLAPITKAELPEVDPSLPPENGLIIDKIGVRGEIHEGDDWETALRQGIWRVPDFATPLSDTVQSDTVTPRLPAGMASSAPIILAAHRWGYLEWSASFRKLNSFYHLPQIKVGDTIQIVWDQRLFEYKVYSTETGTQITDYNAKLILYTCQLWNSPARFFVYANRVAL